MLAFARRSATVGTYIPVLISIMLIIIIIVPMLNIVARVVSTAFCTDGRFIAICVMIAFVRSGFTVGACQPMLIEIIFIAVIILVINIAAGVVNAANKTDGWFIAICGMRPFFGRSAATGTYPPMLISIVLEAIIVILVLNTTAGVISATCCTDTGLIAICGMRPFFGRSAAIGAYIPMLIGVMLIIIIIVPMLSIVTRVVSIAYCTDGWLIAICIMLTFVRRSAAIGAYLPMIIGVSFIIVIIRMQDKAI